jgi:LuxR family maltose regulon positive regulatory protein
MVVSSPLLSTKICIPTSRKEIISRLKLIDQLNTGRECKLILVSAPAGYGKTTLLIEWISQLAISVGWVSLDAQDNDLRRFFSYLIASLKSIGIHINGNIFPDLKDQDLEKLSEYISVLINQVSSSSRPIYLVLDDFHLINNHDIHQTITYLLENLPQNMHLVIATRSDPLLRLAKLRAQGELFEIRADDLHFTLEEVAQYLNTSMDLGLSLDEISILAEKTEGWIVGLQLAAISLHKNPDQQQFIRNFAGDDRYIADYLLDEALSRQPEHVHNFLIQTSILELMCAPLCNAITGRNDSLEILDYLDQANLFLVPLDDKGDWYRYHFLFRDLLRKHLKQIPRKTTRELYQRASKWFEQNQLLSEAVRMALISDDSARVAKLMEGYLLTIVSTSELGEMNQLLRSLSENRISDDPWLALALAWGLAYEGESGKAEMLVEVASDRIEDSDGKIRSQLKGRSLVLRAYLAGTRADYTKSIQFAYEALKEVPESDLSIRSFTILIIGNAFRFQGKLKDAIHYHQQALNLSESASDTFLSVIILSRLVDIYRITGQVNLSCMTGLDTLKMIDYHQNKIGVTTFVEGYLKLRMSRSYYERNELDEAIIFADMGLELAKQWGAYDSLSLGYFNFCQIYQALGDSAKAESYLQEFIEKYPFASRFQYQTALAYKAELAVRKADIQSADFWVESSGLQVSDNIQFLQIKFYDVLAQVLIAQKKFADARVLLKKLLQIAVESGAVEHEIRIRGRMALILKAEGDEKSALDMFAPALKLAATGIYVRTILDMGEDIAQVLYGAVKNGILVDYCLHLLENFQSQKQAKALDDQVLVEPLSSRENEVLELIALGYTNQEIAEELYLSLHTIKSHARNIFSKLGVKNRTEAVARARLLGVLPQE